MKRIFDLFFGLVLLVIFFLPILLISLLIKLESNGPIIYFSNRIGQNNKTFVMPKFRTMFVHSPQVASDKLLNPSEYVTKIGKILRKFSLDEIPQIFTVLNGPMSIVGPRPALYNQSILIDQRTKLGIDKLKPGITGWAQINGWRGETDTDEKIIKRTEYDIFYINNWSIWFDLKIILLTIIKEFTNKKVY